MRFAAISAVTDLANLLSTFEASCIRNDDVRDRLASFIISSRVMGDTENPSGVGNAITYSLSNERF